VTSISWFSVVIIGINSKNYTGVIAGHPYKNIGEESKSVRESQREAAQARVTSRGEVVQLSRYMGGTREYFCDEDASRGCVMPQ
jgi:hypothetical protein